MRFTITRCARAVAGTGRTADAARSQVKGAASLLRHYIAEACSEVQEQMSQAVTDESSGLGRAGKL